MFNVSIDGDRSSVGAKAGTSGEMTRKTVAVKFFCNQMKRDYTHDEDRWDEYTAGGLGFKSVEVSKSAERDEIRKAILKYKIMTLFNVCIVQQ